MPTTSTDPRIYVACLAAYNSGKLHGRWIDAAQDADDLHAEIRDMLAASPEPGAEEWAIHDYEGFDGLSLSEYESIDDVAAIAAGIDEHGEAFAAYVANVGGIEYADDFEDAYCGQWDSEQDYAENFFDDVYSGEVPDFLEGYIDFEKFTRDLFMDHYSTQASGGGVHVFRST